VICYFDTSAFIKLVIRSEPGASEASDLWDGARRVLSSVLLYPEGRAALARARRDGRLDDRGLRSAQRDFERLWHGLDVLVPVEDLAIRAGMLAAQVGLRGCDAVHLSSAEALGDPTLVVVAADRALSRAARELGLSVAEL
jgi:predicted nucleic acid-binding protein